MRRAILGTSGRGHLGVGGRGALPSEGEGRSLKPVRPDSRVERERGCNRQRTGKEMCRNTCMSRLPTFGAKLN